MYAMKRMKHQDLRHLFSDKKVIHMTTKQFREEAKALGLTVRKQSGLEVFNVSQDGTELCKIYYSELYHFASISEVLAKKLKPVASLG